MKKEHIHIIVSSILTLISIASFSLLQFYFVLIFSEVSAFIEPFYEYYFASLIIFALFIYLSYLKRKNIINVSWIFALLISLWLVIDYFALRISDGIIVPKLINRIIDSFFLFGLFWLIDLFLMTNIFNKPNSNVSNKKNGTFIFSMVLIQFAIIFLLLLLRLFAFLYYISLSITSFPPIFNVVIAPLDFLYHSYFFTIFYFFVAPFVILVLCRKKECNPILSIVLYFVISLLVSISVWLAFDMLDKVIKTITFYLNILFYLIPLIASLVFCSITNKRETMLKQTD